MDSHRWKEHNENDVYFLSDYDGALDRCVPDIEHSPPMSSSPSILPNSSPPRVGYIEHPVSKLDTLAGIAIKYGVEVSDIKKMNGLVTDLQMFALKTLHIPLPGRHPPSDGSTTTGLGSSGHSPPDQGQDELFESLRWKVSPAMSSLQGFYRLKPTIKKTISEGYQMEVCRKGASYSSENDSFSRNSTMPKRPLSCHRKSKSLVDIILNEIAERSDIVPAAEAREGDSDKWNDKLVRRRQKSEVDFATPELLLREDNSCGGYSSRTGKGLAQRQKAASRITLPTGSEVSGLNHVPIRLEDAFLTDGPSGVKKSSSTSCLQDQDNCSSSSIWPTSRWSLKPDLQAFSTAAIAKPMFDGLPKPITGRKNKAALD